MFFAMRIFFTLITLLFLMSFSTVWATDNHEYGSNEYDVIFHGTSPNGKFAISTHGSKDNYGYSDFHLYLIDAAIGKPISTLYEIAGTLDTGAGAFIARWSANSSEVLIIYRISRHEPLKVISYKITNEQPKSSIGVIDANDELANFWSVSVNTLSSPEKIYSTALKDSGKIY